MFGYLLVMFTGYYAIASLRSFLTWLSKESDRDMSYWVNEHPYHFVLQAADLPGPENPVGLLGGTLAFITWIASGIMLGVGFSFFAIPLFLGTSIYGLVALTYWMHTKEIFKKWQITRLWEKCKALWKSRTPIETIQAKKLQRELLRIIKGKKRKKQLKPILKKVDKLVKEELPRLLTLRDDLEVQINDAQTTIQRQKDNGICEGEEELMSESEKGLGILQKRGKNVKKRIEYILTSLDHMSVRFDLIMSAESTSQSQEELTGIHEDLDIMLKAKGEIDDLYHELALNGVPELDTRPEDEIQEEEDELIEA